MGLATFSGVAGVGLEGLGEYALIRGLDLIANKLQIILLDPGFLIDKSGDCYDHQASYGILWQYENSLEHCFDGRNWRWVRKTMGQRNVPEALC